MTRSILLAALLALAVTAVSYTHLDVYKRQVYDGAKHLQCALRFKLR